MRLSEIQTFSMPMERGGIYFVHFPPGDCLILTAGANIGTAAEYFRHPNIIAKIPRVFDLKHYHPYRGKWWTVKGGIDFLFAIPKSKIRVVEEIGYSYPKIRIGSETYSLNVSGGTFPENCWTDNVRQGSHVGIKCTLRTLRNLAKHGISPEVCEAKGIRFDVTKNNRPERLRDLVAEIRTKRELKSGSQIMLVNGAYYRGEQGPFVLKRNPPRKREIVCQTETGAPFRVPYKCINWKCTAELNEIDLSPPKAFNRVGEVKERERNV